MAICFFPSMNFFCRERVSHTSQDLVYGLAGSVLLTFSTMLIWSTAMFSVIALRPKVFSLFPARFLYLNMLPSRTIRPVRPVISATLSTPPKLSINVSMQL